MKDKNRHDVPKKSKKKHDKGGANNVTVDRLSFLPFKTAKALKVAQEEVRLTVWRRMEEARVMYEFLQLEQYAFWHDEFKSGLVCAYGEKEDPNLVRVFSEGSGIRININRGIAESAPSSEAVLGVLVESMSKSFAATYYRAKGILASEDTKEDELKNKLPTV